MKAQRKRLYDADDIDFYNNDPDPFEDANHDTKLPHSHHPRRSVTLNDFFAPGLLVHSDENITQDFAEEENFGEPYFEEEDFYGEDFDLKELKRCFAELDAKYDYSKCNRSELENALFECNYDVPTFVQFAFENDLGLTVKKKKPAPSKLIQSAKTKTQSQQRDNSAPKEPKLTILRSQSQMPFSKPMKQHQDCKRSIQNVQGVLASSKKRINVVIVGHVDAGKSTLMGHLLCLTGNVSHGEMTKLTKASQELGRPEDCYAWVMAKDETERERGVTIDVSMTEFQTQHLIVTVLDAPGHRDFVPNMIAGASQADAALLVVDVSNPLFDCGQAREHLLLCRSLGVSSLIVAINKMDRIEYRQSGYDDVKARLTAFLKSLNWNAISFIPTASNTGDNLKVLSERTSSWYNGPTILEAIDKLPPPSYDMTSPFLFCVSECYNSNSRGIVATGRIECGYVCPTDNLHLLPGDSYVKVSKVEVNGKQVDFASAGTIASIYISTAISSENVPVGSAFAAPERTLQTANQFVARISTFSMSVPLLKGAALVFHRQAVDVPLQIAQIKSILNKKTKKVMKKSPGFVAQNSMAEVVFRVQQPIPIDLNSESKSFGRFIIRANGATLGYGSIIDIIQDPSQQHRSDE